MQILKPEIWVGAGSRFLMYPPHATPTPAQGHSEWSGSITKPEGAPFAIDSQQSFSGCPSARNIKQFSVLHGDAGPFSQSTFQPVLKATPSAESSGGGGGGRILAQAFDSDCALSLLSAAAAPDSGIGQMLPAGRIAMRQPPLPLASSDLAYATAQASCYAPAPTTFSGSGGAEDGTVGGDVFVCEAAAGAGLHCQCVYNAMGGGDETSQALPFFSWQWIDRSIDRSLSVWQHILSMMDDDDFYLVL